MSEDKISALNSIKVDAWGTGNRNDCYWNIAANQLGEGASAQEIQALCNQLQQYNQEKNTAIQRQGEVLCAGDQVFIPLEYAMDEIQTNVSTKQEEITGAQKELSDAQKELSDANISLNSALADYSSKLSEYNNASDEDKANLQAALEDAKQAYLDALQKQDDAKSKADEKQELIDTKKSELEQYKKELDELKQEYADEKDEYQEELAKLDEHIASIETNIQETEGSIEQAKAEQQAAKNQQEDALALGVVKNDDGTYSLDDSNITQADIDAACINSQNTMTALEYTDKEIAEEKYIDGGRTKSVTYSDGTSAEFYKDPETGEWSALPSVMYDSEGGATYMAKVSGEDIDDGLVQPFARQGSDDMTQELTAISNNIKNNPEGAVDFINEYIESGNYNAVYELAQIYSGDEVQSSLLEAYKDNPEMCTKMVNALQQAYNEGDAAQKEEIASLIANDIEKSLTNPSNISYYGNYSSTYNEDEVMKAIFGSDENGNYNISDELMTDIKRAYNKTGTENERSLEKSLDSKDLYNYGDRIDKAGVTNDYELASQYVSDIQQDQWGGGETNALKEYFNSFGYDNSDEIASKSSEYYRTTNISNNTVENLLENVDTSNMTKEEAQNIIGKLYSNYNSSDKIIDAIRNLDSATQEKYMPILAELYVLANQEE